MKSYKTVLVWSCGGNSGEKKTIEDTKEQESYSLDTQEGMMKMLQGFNIDIPENLTFAGIKKSPTNRYKGNMAYGAQFKIENIDDATKKQLYDWHANQFSVLIADGWSKVDYRENVEMMGGAGVYSTYSLKKSKTGGSYYLLSINLTYKQDNKNVTLTLSPGESSDLVN